MALEVYIESPAALDRLECTSYVTGFTIHSKVEDNAFTFIDDELTLDLFDHDGNFPWDNAWSNYGFLVYEKGKQIFRSHQTIPISGTKSAVLGFDTTKEASVQSQTGTYLRADWFHTALELETAPVRTILQQIFSGQHVGDPRGGKDIPGIALDVSPLANARITQELQRRGFSGTPTNVLDNVTVQKNYWTREDTPRTGLDFLKELTHTFDLALTLDTTFPVTFRLQNRANITWDSTDLDWPVMRYQPQAPQWQFGGVNLSFDWTDTYSAADVSAQQQYRKTSRPGELYTHTFDLYPHLSNGFAPSINWDAFTEVIHDVRVRKQQQADITLWQQDQNIPSLLTPYTLTNGKTGYFTELSHQITAETVRGVFQELMVDALIPIGGGTS